MNATNEHTVAFIVRALSLNVKLPDGVPVLRTRQSVLSGSKNKAREKRGTIGWVKTTGEPGPCHRRNGNWFTNQETLDQLILPGAPVPKSVVNGSPPLVSELKPSIFSHAPLDLMAGTA